MTVEGNAPLTRSSDEAERELRRPRDGRMVAGVCAGLAAYFGLRPAVYRIAFAALALVGGAGILLYAVSALVIPAEGAEESIAEEFLRSHRDQPGLLIGLGVAGVVAILLVSASGPGDWGWPLTGPLSFLLLLAVAGLALWAVSERDRGARRRPDADQPARAPSPSLFLPGLGVLLAAAGVAALLDVLDVVDVPLDVALAVALVVVGGLVVVGAVLRRRATGLALLGVVLALLLGGVALADLGDGGPVGDRDFHPATAADLEGEYNVRIGSLELDLRDLELPPGDTRVEANVGIGELVVIVPDDAAVDATADVEAGEVTVLGRDDDGWDVRERVVEEGAAGSQRRLVVEAKVGFGDLEIRRAADGP
jgi:phage shock protein PspC (stress-responsive transcriptional regulator)